MADQSEPAYPDQARTASTPPTARPPWVSQIAGPALLLFLFKKWATGGPNSELNQSKTQFFNDCTNNTLPQQLQRGRAVLQTAPGSSRRS